MTSTLTTKAIINFFFEGGATKALFRWLDFRLFVSSDNKTLEINNSDAKPNSATEYLNKWQQKFTLSSPATGLIFVANVLAVLIGFTAMAGVLNYSAQPLINIWLPLGLFAFIPVLLTLVSLYFSVLSSTKHSLNSFPLIMFMINKLKLDRFLAYKNLLLPWLFWRLQMIAILFSLSALLSFFLLATFQDYRFGWSSTLITDHATMTELMSVMTWPWHWFIESPTAELISQSHFSVDTVSVSVQLDQTWWLTLVMAMLVYGLLPRVLLALFLRQRFIKQLRSSIVNSSDVEQFIVAQQHQETRDPIESEQQLENTDEVTLSESDSDLITWRQAQFDLPVIKNLGSTDWLDDEQWLNSPASHCKKPVWVIVDPLQTPTGELADCIDVLKQNNVSVALVLYPYINDDSRYSQQLKSWQFFAHRYGITLKKGN